MNPYQEKILSKDVMNDAAIAREEGTVVEKIGRYLTAFAGRDPESPVYNVSRGPYPGRLIAKSAGVASVIAFLYFARAIPRLVSNKRD